MKGAVRTPLPPCFMPFTQNHLEVSIPEILDLANLFVAEAPLKKKVLPPPSEHFDLSVQKQPMGERVNTTDNNSKLRGQKTYFYGHTDIMVHIYSCTIFTYSLRLIKEISPVNF